MINSFCQKKDRKDEKNGRRERGGNPKRPAQRNELQRNWKEVSC